jgi:hypothetical protein
LLQSAAGQKNPKAKQRNDIDESSENIPRTNLLHFEVESSGANASIEMVLAMFQSKSPQSETILITKLKTRDRSPTQNRCLQSKNPYYQSEHREMFAINSIKNNEREF